MSTHAKVTTQGEKLTDKFVEFYNDRIYRVNSYGQTFNRCKVLGYADNHGVKQWRFESLDPDTKGYRFSVFERNFSSVDS